MRHVFIINPVSGKANPAGQLLPMIEAAAQRQGVPVETVLTAAPKHAAKLADQYGAQGEPVRLYAVGGDGTLNEVLAGAWRHKNAQVACIPCGSGNDFIRSFGAAESFLDIDAQIAGVPLTIDLMEVEGGICAGVTSTGLDAEVAYGIPKYRRIPLLGGSMAYNISILERLLHRLGKQLRITIDGRQIEDRYLIATVCNAQNYGGGFCPAPMADLSDGLLNVVLVKKMSRLLIASIIGKFKKGKHCRDGAIVPEMQAVMEHHVARRVEISPTGREAFILNVDGECGPAPRLVASVLPGAARFMLPATLAKNRPTA